MSNQVDEAKELKSSIELLTKNIFENVLSTESHPIDELIQRRTLQIAKLISLLANTKEAVSLRQYLCTIKQIDENIIQAILVKKDVLKMAINNVEKLKRYINV